MGIPWAAPWHPPPRRSEPFRRAPSARVEGSRIGPRQVPQQVGPSGWPGKRYRLNPLDERVVVAAWSMAPGCPGIRVGWRGRLRRELAADHRARLADENGQDLARRRQRLKGPSGNIGFVERDRPSLGESSISSHEFPVQAAEHSSRWRIVLGGLASRKSTRKGALGGGRPSRFRRG